MEGTWIKLTVVGFKMSEKACRNKLLMALTTGSNQLLHQPSGNFRRKYGLQNKLKQELLELVMEVAFVLF